MGDRVNAIGGAGLVERFANLVAFVVPGQAVHDLRNTATFARLYKSRI
jgi:hypothetical protein